MPLINRPRVVIDGVRRTRTYRFFWCRQCDRTVRLTSASLNPPYNFLCPLCYNLVCQEINISRPSSSSTTTSSSSAARLLDTMAQIINLSPHRSSLRPQFAFNNSLSRPLPRPESPSHENVTNHEPFDQMPQNQTTENNTCSFMTLVRVTADTLRMSSDSTCPICKEDFLLNQEIQKLECNHFYHSHCIMSWLQINNTCPVCRYCLPIHQHATNNFQGANYGRNSDDNDDDDYDLHLEDVVNLSWPSWTELLSLLRPFRLGSLLDWSLP